MHQDLLIEAIKKDRAAELRDLVAAQPELARMPIPGVGSPLMLAIYMRASQCIATLEATGVRPTIYEASALGRAADVAALLGPDNVRAPGPDGFTPLHLAAHFGREEVAQLLLKRGADPRLISSNALRNTPLHAATAGRQHALMRLLIDAGAMIDAKDSGGNTPLAIAAATSDADAAKLLLERGANRSAANHKDEIPVDHAKARGHAAVVELLSIK